MAARSTADAGLDSVLRPLARPLLRSAVRLRVGPNRLAVVSLLLALVAAIWLSGGDLLGGIVGAAVLVLVLLCDVAGRDLPGTPQQPRDFAPALARCGEALVYLGVVIGGVVPGTPYIWHWATVATLCLGVRSVLATARDLPAAAPGQGVQASPPNLVAEVDPSRPAATEDPGHDAAFATEILGGTTTVAAARRSPERHPDAPDTRRGTPGRPLRTGAPVVFGLRTGREQRLALVAVTLAIPDPRVTFLALIGFAAWGIVAETRPRTARATRRAVD